MKFRLLCFGSHLLMSFAVALVSLCVVFLLWYPSPLHLALGVESIFLLLLVIDVIVGPLLTLIVAKQGKRTLKMDLLTIGFIQVFALIYGLYIVAQGRPVWIVYDSNRFELVQAYEAIPQSKEMADPSVFNLGFTGPVWAAVIESLPADLAKGDAYYKSEFLKVYSEEVASKVGAHARPLEVLKRFNDPLKVEAILSAYPDVNAFVPIAGKEKSLAVLVNKSIGHPISIVDLSPW